MIFNEKYRDIMKSKKDLENELGKDFCIENDIMHNFEIYVTGHFGNCVSFSLICEKCCPPNLRANTNNIGFIIRFLVDFFDKEDDNSVSIRKSLNEIPIRLVYDSKESWGGKCIGIGHFMKDRFILIDDLCKLNK